MFRKQSRKLHCCLALCAAARGGLKESLGGLMLDVGFRCSWPHKPLASLPNLASHSCFVREEQTGIQPTTLEDLGHPVVAILISEEAVFLDTYFSSYLLLFCFFFSPDILKAI